MKQRNWKRLLLWAVPAVLLLTAVILLTRHTGDPRDQFVIPDQIVLCLDPGHGGEDGGATLEDRLEKDDNLKLALAVREALEGYGFENLTVLLTREADTSMALEERAAFANEAKATLFVSLHRNSGGGRGVETWTSADAFRPESRLAKLIQTQLVQVGVSKDRGVKHGTASNPHASYYVVGHTEMPAVLVELGFLDNAEDNALLDAHLTDYAAAVARGLLQMVELL